MTTVDGSFDSAGVPIRYVVHGDGEPVVLVHSYQGTFEGQFVRTGVADALGQRYRVIGFDLRGHGKSGKPHDPALYGREMALDIVRLLDHLTIDKAHIVGYSLGAHLVALLLTLHPERFASAILGGSAGRRRWSADDDARVEKEAAEMEAGRMDAQILRLLPPGAPTPSEAQLREVSERYLAGNDVRALAAIRRGNHDQVVTDAELATAGVPTLGIVGTRDPYVQSFHDLGRVMPDMRLVVVEGGTHNGTPARPEFVTAVLDFISAHALSP